MASRTRNLWGNEKFTRRAIGHKKVGVCGYPQRPPVGYTE